MSQAESLLNLLSDGKPHSTFEITRIVYGLDHAGVCRISARIKELRDRGFDIDGFKDKENKARYWYQLKGEKSASPLHIESEAVADSGESVTPDLYRTQLNLLAG